MALDDIRGVFKPPMFLSRWLPARTACVAFFNVGSCFFMLSVFGNGHCESALAGRAIITGALTNHFVSDGRPALEAVAVSATVNQ